MSNDRIAYLLQRYYDDTSTPAEQEELWQLMQQEKTDAALSNAIDQLIRNTTTVLPMEQATADDILRNILQQAPAAKQRRMTWLPWAAAAAIIGVLAIGWYLLGSTEEKAVNRQLVTATPHYKSPASKKVILVLDDGSQLSLGTADSSLIAQRTGATVKTDSGVLAYNGHGAVQHHEVRTPAGIQYTVILPDGSKAFLNAASSLRYPTVFANNNRTVEMTGEVYFDIAGSAAAPFTVKAGTAQIDVLGTAFNVMAYQDEPAMRTTLVQGAVRVRKGAAFTRLDPGQQAVILPDGDLHVQKANVAQAIAWKEDVFEFNHDIKDIMRQIARWYDVTIEYQGDISGRSYIATISRKERLQDVLSKLEEAGGIHFRIADQKVIVMP